MSPTMYNTFTNASEITPYVEFIKKIKEIHSNYEDIQAGPMKSGLKGHDMAAPKKSSSKGTQVGFIPVKINYIIYGFVSYDDSYKVY